MSIGRVVGILVLVVVLYAVISQPRTSADTVNDGAGALGDAGTQVTVFLTALFSGASDGGGYAPAGTTRSSTGSGSPRGGVETGDGSYPIGAPAAP